MESPDAVWARFDNAGVSGGATPIAAMHYEYDKLDDDALIKGWLTHSNNQLYDVAGKPVYFDTIQPVSPMRWESSIYYDEETIYYIEIIGNDWILTGEF